MDKEAKFTFRRSHLFYIEKILRKTQKYYWIQQRNLAKLQNRRSKYIIQTKECSLVNARRF